MALISQATKNQLFIASANRFTRLGRQMNAWELIQAEDLGRIMMQSKEWNIQGIGKHLVRFVERIQSEWTVS